jgi:hypothetical protein
MRVRWRAVGDRPEPEQRTQLLEELSIPGGHDELEDEALAW